MERTIVVDLEKKKETLRKLSQEIAETERKHVTEELFPIAKKLFKGKYLKYRNSYSLPEGPLDYWYMFGYVYDVKKNGTAKINHFQIDKYGTLTVEIAKCFVWQMGGEIYSSNWTTSTKKEYQTAIKAVHCKIKGLKTPG